MAYYDKKVIYLAEMEYGNRIKGAGFVRMECRGKSCSFDMHVSGMTALAEKKYDIYVVSAEGQEYPAGGIFLHKGSGEWKEVYDEDRIGIAYQEIAEIRVRISETKILTGRLPLRAKTMRAAEIKEQAVKANEETVKRDMGESRGIWKFVRGGSGQADTEAEKRMPQNSGDEWNGKNRPEKRDGIFSKLKGESGWEEKESDGKHNGMERYERRKPIFPAEDGGRSNAKPPADAGNSAENSMDNVRPITWGETNPGHKWTRDERGAEQEGGRGAAIRKKISDLAVSRPTISKEAAENVSENVQEIQKKQWAKVAETGKEEKVQIEDVILDDKWEQLKQIYSVVHPYEDDRQYIAVQPKDFVIMTGDYQHLANNSFLLHGFYNYRHIVLGREPDGNFYLGVPGVYYEREKMVALMFGFEAFECDGGKAEAGKFGYYLRKVKI